MDPKYSDVLINKLIEENKRLKKMIIHKSVNEKVLNEKLNVIRFIFSSFENCKDIYNASSIILFGSFLEKLFYKKELHYKDDLKFYFKIHNYPFPEYNISEPTYALHKFFNIINNIDFFKQFKIFNETYGNKWVYNVEKNNVKFRVIFYENNYIINKTSFDIQNIQFSSTMGLSIKYLSDIDINKNITNHNIAFLEVMKSNYLNRAINLSKKKNINDIPDYIDTEDILEEQGFKIVDGLKNMLLVDKCSICYETNIKGLYLKCRHIFCRDCIKKHIKADGSNKKCPMCRNKLSFVYD